MYVSEKERFARNNAHFDRSTRFQKLEKLKMYTTPATNPLGKKSRRPDWTASGGTGGSASQSSARRTWPTRP